MPLANGSWLIRALPLLGFLVVGGFFLWGLNPERDPREIPSVLIGKPPPKFIIPPIDGMETQGLATSDLPSPRPTLLNVFASWCVPCVAEHAVLTRMANEQGIRLLGINYKDKPEEVSNWLGRLGNPYERIGADEDGRIGIEWGISGVPETFVLAADGKILHRVVGPILDKKEAEVLAILRDSRP